MNRTKEFFDSYADEWDKVNRYDRPEGDFRNLIEQLKLPKSSKVVDLGCGTGVLVPYILEKLDNTGEIYAVDISEKMLKKLSEKFPNENIKTFSLGAEELSKINCNNIDAVICFSMFPHVKDKQKALFEISKITKPKSKLLIAHFSSRKEINDFHSNLPHPICHHVLPDEKGITEMLNEAGFEIIHLKDEPSKYELLAEKRG